MIPLDEVAAIETPEQLSLELPLAGIGSRAIAFFYDSLLQLVPITVAAIAAFALAPPIEGQWFGKDAAGVPSLKSLPLAILTLSMFAVNFGYYSLFEALWRGQSPGKRWMGLRVVRDGGFPIDGRGALLRNLLRVVDALPGFYLVGLLSLFLGGAGKRIGDYAAGTIVVRERRPGQRPLPEPRLSKVLTAEEAALVLEFLDRREGLADPARTRLAHRIAHRIALRLGRPDPTAPEAFLEGWVDAEAP